MSDQKMDVLPPKSILTYEQEQVMTEARVSFMNYSPFFCFYYYDVLTEYPTYGVSTLAIDGRRVFINPAYMMTLTPMERAFALTHEVYHGIRRHPERMKFYKDNGVKGLPYDHLLMNFSMDYVINADLINMKIGACHPSWLYDPKILATELPEDVYVRLYKKPPPQPQQPTGPGPCPPGRPGDKPGQPSSQPPTQGAGGTPVPVNPNANGDKNKTFGDVQKSTRHDTAAEKDGGRFDGVLEPFEDPVTGAEDIPTGTEFMEAVARAAAAAKAVGSMPGRLQSMIDEILEPQVNWRDHLRMVVTGKVGKRNEDWSRPNRRRITTNPPVIAPGKRGSGCELVTCVVDTSGSISSRELGAFFGEMSGILADCRPRRVQVIWCDAAVQRVDEVVQLEELTDQFKGKIPGGGGTSFRPPFSYLSKENVRPDTLVYLTDMLGPFPSEAPNYPVVWCSTTKSIKGPFGETVYIDV